MNRSFAMALLCAAACGGSQSEAPAAAEAPAADTPAAQPEATRPEATAKPPIAADAAPAAVGKPAPAFALPDLAGATVELSAFRGKTVVIEWFNPGCPFIVHAHGKGPLGDLSSIPGAVGDGVVWLAINSSAPGKQGHGAARNAAARDEWRVSYPILMDETGAVGKLYEARTTPHMYVIDPEGVLVYRGALDNAPLGRLEGGEARNYVAEALADVAAGRPVRTAETKSYGCSVKY